ncbi:MAG: hypothetical protein AAF153_00450, partial [Pseudomonadota bacterium]
RVVHTSVVVNDSQDQHYHKKIYDLPINNKKLFSISDILKESGKHPDRKYEATLSNEGIDVEVTSPSGYYDHFKITNVIPFNNSVGNNEDKKAHTAINKAIEYTQLHVDALARVIIPSRSNKKEDDLKVFVERGKIAMITFISEKAIQRAIELNLPPKIIDKGINRHDGISEKVRAKYRSATKDK